jgi:KDO2-lipid IV(A) lauroyltransferase
MNVATEIPPHAPEVGRARRLLGDYHVTGLFWYRFHCWSMANMPDWTKGLIITTFTTFFFFTILKIRRAIASNLDVVLGRAGFFARQGRIYRTMWTFAWCLSERYERLTTSRPFTVEAEGLEHWRAVAGGTTGFVMVTAHLGMYEVGSMVPAAKEDRHVHLVREPEVDPRAQEFIRQCVRTVESSHYTMHFQTADPLQGMTYLDALRRGEIVAMQGDRPRTGSRTVDATLFGRPIALPSGPAVLARAAGAPMLPVFAIREGRRRCRVIFGPPVTVPRTDDRNADLTWAMGRIAAEVERAVRRAPEQWFVFRELWPGASPRKISVIKHHALR